MSNGENNNDQLINEKIEKKNDGYKNKQVNEWYVKDVQAWFNDFDEGKFKEYAKDFKVANGKDLLEIKEVDLKQNYGPFNGGILYKAIQNLKVFYLYL
jgi:hypothetical protein